MKKAAYTLLIAGMAVFVSSCGQTCIRCTKIAGTESQEFCSDLKEERNDFIVDWTHQGYNCEEIPESEANQE